MHVTIYEHFKMSFNITEELMWQRNACSENESV